MEATLSTESCLAGIQKVQEEAEQDLQESGNFISEMLTGQGWFWLLLGLVAAVLVLAALFCLAEGREQPKEATQWLLRGENYTVQMWTLTEDGTVRVLRRIPIP